MNENKNNISKFSLLPIITFLIAAPFIGFKFPLHYESIMIFLHNTLIISIIIFSTLALIIGSIIFINQKYKTKLCKSKYNLFSYLLYFVNLLTYSFIIILIIKEVITPTSSFIDNLIWPLGILCSVKFIYAGIMMMLLNPTYKKNTLLTNDKQLWIFIQRKSGINSMICGLLLISVILLTGNKVIACFLVPLRFFLCDISSSVEYRKQDSF